MGALLRKDGVDIVHSPYEVWWRGGLSDPGY
jgi:hypothetical protein